MSCVLGFVQFIVDMLEEQIQESSVDEEMRREYLTAKAMVTCIDKVIDAMPVA